MSEEPTVDELQFDPAAADAPPPSGRGSADAGGSPTEDTVDRAAAPEGDGSDAGSADEDRAGTSLAPQQLMSPAASPPEPPARTGVFVEIPALRAYVGDLLRVFLGGYQVDAFGNMTFVYEGARIFVTVGMSPLGPQVGVFSITNLDVQLREELARFLVTTNHRLGLGAFSYDAENSAVWLRHSLLGTTLDAPELHTTVAAVASTAAHFDDLIKGRFGGRTFDEAPREVQEATTPPPPNASGYL